MPVTGYMSYTKLLTTLSVLSKQRTYDADGGWSDVWTATGVEVAGMLATATTRELMLAQQMQFPTTHVLVVEGVPVAQIGQRFAAEDLDSGQSPSAGTRLFQINDTDNYAELGAYTSYTLEEVM